MRRLVTRRHDHVHLWSPSKHEQASRRTTVVTVTAGIRRQLGWQEGDALELTATDGGALVVKRAQESEPDPAWTLPRPRG